MISVKSVVKALEGCIDPELGASIVDIGLVYGIRIIGGNNVKVTLTMTSPMCPLAGAILSNAKQRLESLKGVGKVELELVWGPVWTPEMMSGDLRYRD